MSIASIRWVIPLDALHRASSTPITTASPALPPADEVIDCSCVVTRSRTSWGAAPSQTATWSTHLVRLGDEAVQRDDGDERRDHRQQGRRTRRRPPAGARGRRGPPCGCGPARPSNHARGSTSVRRHRGRGPPTPSSADEVIGRWPRPSPSGPRPGPAPWSRRAASVAVSLTAATPSWAVCLTCSSASWAGAWRWSASSWPDVAQLLLDRLDEVTGQLRLLLGGRQGDGDQEPGSEGDCHQRRSAPPGCSTRQSTARRAPRRRRHAPSP